MLSVFASPLLLHPFEPFDPFEPFQGWHYGRNRGVTAQERDGALEIEVEVPRFAPSDLSVTAHPENSTLVVTGRRVAADGAPDEFRRVFEVSATEYNHREMKWSAEHGVLRIRVPRAAETRVAVAADQRAVALPPAAEALEAVNQMAWPPEFKRSETASQIEFKAKLPAALAAEHVDVRLRGSGILDVSVRAHVETVKKDEHGRAYFRQSQASTRSTALHVPPNTVASDVNVRLNEHEITITVQKHAA